jgi:aerobic C4-dicarboxylate transport protein
MAIVFSVDKFMSEVRALTNITGNGIATVFVWWWEDELDHERLHANLNKTIDRSDVETAITTGWRGRKVIKARSKARFVAFGKY